MEDPDHIADVPKETFFYKAHARFQRGGRESGPIPLKNHKNIGFLSNTGPDPLKITKLPSQHSMFQVIIGTPAKRHLNDDFRWRADDSPPIVVCGSSLPSSTKKSFSEFDPPLTKLSGSAHEALPDCKEHDKKMIFFEGVRLAKRLMFLDNQSRA